MSRARESQIFTALKVEGGILSPEFLRKIADLDAPEQKAADYDLSRSLKIKQEIDRYWLIASDRHRIFRERRLREDIDDQAEVGEKWMEPLLRDVLGYTNLTKVSEEVVIDERTFSLTHQACEGAVPLLLVDHSFDLDKAHEKFGDATRSKLAPHNLMQEYLNCTDKSLWGVVSNGSKFRILRHNPSLTRPAYIECDLDQVFEEGLSPDFAAFWLTLHASRLEPKGDERKPADCILETWSGKSREVGERARDRLRVGVTEALRQLGNGFLHHPDSQMLRKKLRSAELSGEEYFEQLLRLVYRLLFLFVVEERDLLFPPDTDRQNREIYQRGYSLSRLRDLAGRGRNYDAHQDLWQGLRVTFYGLGVGIEGIGLPALGGLFRREPESDRDALCPDLERAAIANGHFLEAIRHLAFFISERGLTRINYRDMGTEELGSVYESLLELQPSVRVCEKPYQFSFFGDADDEDSNAGGSQRKLTGSYYTVPSMVSELIKSALDPVIERTIEENPKAPVAALLDLNIVDPACGSGHFLLAASRRMAVEIARLRSGDDSVEENLRREALRDVVQNCIYGVDRNAFAVDLCKAALWMEAVVPGKPLTFLDSHVLEGDSLIGVFDREIIEAGIPNDAYKALTGDQRTICTGLKRQNRQAESEQRELVINRTNQAEIIGESKSVKQMPENSLDQINQKNQSFRQLNNSKKLEKLYADLYVAAWFAEKTQGNLHRVPLTQDMHRLNDGDQLRRMEVEKHASELSENYKFFHWYLEFPDVMSDGGFDVMLGNPPWERIKLQDEEFFAVRAPDITHAPNAAARDAMIEALNSEDAPPGERRLYQDFMSAKRRSEAASHYCHSSGRFPLTGRGDVNTYTLFSELFLDAINSRGRSGLIVPTGIAVDKTTMNFFRYIVEEKRLVSLFDFENKYIFPGVHRSLKFCLLSLSGKRCPISEAVYAFYLHHPEDLKDGRRRFVLTDDDFELFQPNTKTVLTFRSLKDKEMTRKIYRNSGGVFWREPREGEAEENPWGSRFLRMFDMANDSKIFRTQKQMEDAGYQLQGNVFIKDDQRWLPLYEAKLFHQYDHRFASFADALGERLGGTKTRHVEPHEKSDPEFVAFPRYWIDQEEVGKKLEKSGDLSEESDEGKNLSTPPSQIFSNSPDWPAARSQRCRGSHQRENRSHESDSGVRSGTFGNYFPDWLFVFRDIARSTDQRTIIMTVTSKSAIDNKTPMILVDAERWLHAFRRIVRSTDERTGIAVHLPVSGVGDSGFVIDYEWARAVASALVLANFNSLPLDWAARFSVGGTHMSFFILKQLPILPPEAYLKQSQCGAHFVELVIPRVLELTYTSWELKGFAEDLGYEGEPFKWDEDRRHRLRSELDAVYAEMYGLDRSDLEHILDAAEPSVSFPTLKKNEEKAFGEFRTYRYVLAAFDQLKRGEKPELQSGIAGG